jgi:hypothetical protein
MYCSTTGTFLQRDPLGNPDQPILGHSHAAVAQIMKARQQNRINSNLYEYAASSPQNLTDPFGLDPELDSVLQQINQAYCNTLSRPVISAANQCCTYRDAALGAVAHINSPNYVVYPHDLIGFYGPVTRTIFWTALPITDYGFIVYNRTTGEKTYVHYYPNVFTNPTFMREPYSPLWDQPFENPPAGVPCGPTPPTLPVPSSPANHCPPANGWPKSRFPCFSEDEVIWTSAGPRAISTVLKGDCVMCYDTVRDMLCSSEVLQVLEHGSDNFSINELVTDCYGSLCVTDGHPLLSENRWRLSHECDGQRLLCLRHGVRREVACDVKRNVYSVNRVFNLVTEAGTYLVGDAQFVASGRIE